MSGDHCSARAAAMGLCTWPNMKLIGISGSLRRGSHSTAILTALLKRLPKGVASSIATIGDLPLYNEDLDGEEQPANVRALRAEVMTCDGLVICSPEYNGGVPGGLKNAIDWLSRPAHRSALKGKHVLMVSSSTSHVGGARMQAQLRTDLSSCQARVLARPQVVVGLAQTKMTEEHFTDEASLAFGEQALGDLVREIHIYKAGQAVLELREALPESNLMLR